MKTTKYILPLFCLLFILASCETLVEMELPAHEPGLVLNAVINPDSLFTVDVSASQGPFSNTAYRQLTDATVQLYQAGKLRNTLHHTGDGIYMADLKPEPLQHYELKVTAPGFPGARANTFIPDMPAISSLKAARTTPTEWDGPAVSVSFTLADIPEQENFYYLQAYTPDVSYVDGRPYRRSVGINLLEPFEEEFTMEDRYFFSDKLFDGETVTLRLLLENSPEQITYLRVAHISREYYEYVRTLEKQSYRDNFATPPTQVANNIQGGMGLFAGYNAVTLEVKP